jgi:pimeloyl-ACP methyl ester carboxylesterase
MRRKGYTITLVVLLVVLLVVVVGPFLVPVPPMQGLQHPQSLAGPGSQFVEVNGIDVHVKTAGEGETLFLLLHGFGASLYSWDAVMQPLSQYGRVVAYDRTGFGLTGRPLAWQGLNPYSPEAAVQMVIALLDHYEAQRAILVGHSAGGIVAMQVALAHPERVQALILVDPAVYTGGGAPQWAKPLLSTPQMRHLGPLVARQLLARGQEIIDRAWHDPEKLSAEMLAYYQMPTRVENWDKALWEFTLASQPAGLEEHLGQLTLPVLVVTGDDDRIVPTADSIRLAGELTDARLEVIAEAGHIPHEEQPLAFMRAVSMFIEEIVP